MSKFVGRSNICASVLTHALGGCQYFLQVILKNQTKFAVRLQTMKFSCFIILECFMNDFGLTCKIIVC